MTRAAAAPQGFLAERTVWTFRLVERVKGIGMRRLPESFVKRVAEMLEEEEVDVYALGLYCLSEDELRYFAGEDRKRVEAIFRTLVEDTKRHAELLKLIVELASR
jgi:hypothetical protein